MRGQVEESSMRIDRIGAGSRKQGRPASYRRGRFRLRRDQSSRGHVRYNSVMDREWRNWADLNASEQQEVRDLYGYMGQAMLECLAWRRNSDERVNNPRTGRAMGRWS